MREFHDLLAADAAYEMANAEFEVAEEAREKASRARSHARSALLAAVNVSPGERVQFVCEDGSFYIISPDALVTHETFTRIKPTKIVRVSN